MDSSSLFEFYDADGNGLITRQELKDVLALYSNEIGLEVDSYLDQIADAVFSEAHLDHAGSITFEALKEVLEKRPNLMHELSLDQQKPRQHPQLRCLCDKQRSYILNRWESLVDSLARWMPVCNKLRWDYISNNLVRVNFFLLVVLSLIGLCAGRIVTYWDSGPLVVLARACGQCLNFLCSAIVLLVCRRSISSLRSYGFGRYLPLDDHVSFHKMFGVLIAGFSLFHTVGHIVNFVLESRMEGKPTLVEYLFSTHPGIGWIKGCACITGWILLLILFIMSTAQSFSRSLGKFELFYYTHLLYIPFWVLLFIHAPRFWYWFIVPFAVFMIESCFRLRNLLTNLTSEGRTTIIKAVPLPSNVIHLVIKQPPNFDYNPGDWIYVLIPQIAKYEWHPFTISSAPEQDGVIWLHIRAVGEWTRSLRNYFKDIEHRNHLSKFIRSGHFSMSMDQFAPDICIEDSSQALGGRERFNHLRAGAASINLPPIPENKQVEVIETRLMPSLTIFIDGPYGSPSSQIFQVEHAVLIATGIGVTPFASILQSIVHHFQKKRSRCPKCSHEFVNTKQPLVHKLRKVDFVWINRDQKSFEWFIKLLAELELTQSQLAPEERFLDIHIHLTALERSQTKSVGLELALYLVHEKNKKDLVTGLRTRTKAGRPDWDEFFTKIQDQKKGKVTVFFCGRPQLGRVLHRQSDKFGFKFRKEIF